MKNLNFLSNLCGLRRASQSSDVGYDCRSTVVRPSFDCRSSLLKLVSVLVLVLTVGVGNAWGDTVTYSNSDFSGGSSGSNSTLTVTQHTPISVSAVGYKASGHVRFYKGGAMTISGATITQVVFTCTSNDYATALAGFTFSSGSCTNSSTTATWTGSTTSLTITSNAQTRYSQFVVTYTPSAASHTLSSAVSPVGGGSVSLSATSVAEGSTATATATPAAHYTFTSWSITGTGASLSSTTTNPTTVTMGTANATVTATFTAVPKASITLSEAGATTTDASTYYVGDSYTLPSSTGASCGTKVLVGWSTVEVAETNTKPTSNFYEKGASVTLAATQTFYAVFATAGGSGTSNATVVFSGANSADYQFSTGSDSEAGSLVSIADIEAGKIAISFNKGSASNWPYYDGSLVRMYKNSTFSITPSSATITRVEVVRSTNTSSNTGVLSVSGLTASGDNTTTNTNVFTGSATSAVSFSNNGQCRFSSISVTYSYTATTYSAYSTTCAAPSQVATPTFSIEGGTYNNNQTVTISCGTASAAIYYTLTTDGSTPADPTSSSTLYSSAITIDHNNTKIKAIAIKGGMTDSEIASATYLLTCATPSISPAAESFCSSEEVTITCATNGASIYYTTNNTTPTASSTPYTGPFEVTTTSTIRAISTKTNYTTSSEATSVTYTAPKTVAEAIAASDGETFHVSGVISHIEEVNLSYHNASYYISADGTRTNELYIFRGKNVGNTDFDAADEIMVGDRVTIYGEKLFYNSTTHELKQGNYICSRATWTITAVSNNNSYGTVSLTGNTITATPESGYRVSTTTSYNVTSGTASVTDNGDNTFTVTPSSDCTVRINFEAIPTHTITFSTNGGSCATPSATVAEGATYSPLPSVTGLTSSCEYGTFEGWTTASSIADASVCPTLYTTSYEMGNADVTLHAVYSKTTGGGSGFTLSLDASGTEYYIAPRSGSNNYMGATTTAGDAETFYIETVNTNKYLYVYENETKTYINIDDNNTSLDIRTNAPTAWTIEESSDLWTFTTTATGSRNLAYNYNNGSPRFASYTGSATYLYQFTKHSSGTTTYSLAANCCTELGTINGSVTLNQSGTSVTVKDWTYTQGGAAAESNISTYNVYLYSDADSYADPISTQTCAYNAKGTGVTFTSLTYGTTYKIKIGATGNTNYCDITPVQVTTINSVSTQTFQLACDVPTNVTASSITSSTATVSWDDVATNYQYVLDNSSSDPAGAGTAVNGAHSVDLTGLTESTTYYFHVRTNCGNSVYSSWATITFNTPAAACSGYSFHDGTHDVSDWQINCFTYSGNSDRQWLKNYTVRNKPNYYVGKEGYFYNSGLGNSNAKSYENDMQYMQLALDREHNSNNQLGSNYAGVQGTLLCYDNSSSDNLYVDFLPDGYYFILDAAGTPTALPMTCTNADMTAANILSNNSVWETTVQTVTSVSYKYTVGIKANSAIAGKTWQTTRYNTNEDMTTLKKRNSSDGFTGTLAAADVTAGTRGKYRIWANTFSTTAGEKNWYAHFVPYFHVTYNGNGALSGSTAASADVSCEGDASARTVNAAVNGFTGPAHTTFGGWATSASGAKVYDENDPITLTADVELFAIWEPEANATITLNNYTGTAAPTNLYAGDSWNLPSANTYVCGEKTFVGWSTVTISTPVNTKPVSNFYEPGASVTLAATNTFYAVFADGSDGEIFSEDFASFTNGSIGSASSSAETSLDGFDNIAYVYQAGGAAKLGTGSYTGSLTTDELTIAAGSTVTISFDVCGWTSVEGDIYVSCDNAAFDQQTVSYTATSNDAMESKSVTVTTTVANPKITIATSYKRAYLDNISISASNYSSFSTTCPTCETVTVAYTASPTGGTVGVKKGVTDVAANGTVNICGATVDLTVKITPASHYTLTGFTATGLTTGSATISPSVGTALPTTSEQTFTVQLSADATGTVTLTPTLEEDAHKVISWVVHGSSASIADGHGTTWVYSGEDLTGIPSAPSAPAGCVDKEFVGWSENDGGATEGDASDYTDLFTNLGGAPTGITTDKTFTAVFATPAAGLGGTVMWEDPFDGYSNGDQPASKSGYNSATISYAYGESGTKVYAGADQHYAGGSQPELMIVKNGGSFTASNIPTASQTELTLTYKTNYSANVSVTSGTSGVTVGDADVSGTTCTRTITISQSPATNNFALTFTMTKSDKNARLDDINIAVPGSSSMSGYVTTCEDTYIITYNKNTSDAVTNLPSPTGISQATGSGTLSNKVPIRYAYTFMGWATTVDGSVAYDAGESISGVSADMTLYAVWQLTAVTEINLSRTSLDKYVGDPSVTLTVVSVLPEGASTDVTWSSSNTTVATVSASGEVNFLAVGTATITATSSVTSGITATCAVTVWAKPTVSFLDNLHSLTEDKDGNALSGYNLTDVAGTPVVFPVLANQPAGSGTCEDEFYVFVGWTTSDNNTDPEDHLVTSHNLTNGDNITYYAVWANGVSGTTYTKLTSSTFKTSPTKYVLGAAHADSGTEHYFYSCDKTDKDNSWGYVTADLASNTPIEFTLSGTAAALVATSTQSTARYLKDKAAKEFWMSASSQTVELKSDGTIYNNNTDETSWRLLYNKAGGLRWYSSNVSGSTNAYFYEVVAGGEVAYRTSCCADKVAAPTVTATKTSTTVTLTWAAVSGATGYELQWNGGAWTAATSGVVKSDLTPNTNYSWRVRATYDPPKCGADIASGSTTTNQVYHVTYAKGSGTGSCNATGSTTDGTAYEAGATVTLQSNGFTLVGHTFNEWTEDDDDITISSNQFTMPEHDVVITATWTPKVDKFYDRMHDGTDASHGGIADGDGKYYITREGCSYTVPSLTDNTSGATACHTKHYVLMGWTAESHLNSDGTLKTGHEGNVYTGGGTQTATGATYYAVWAEVEE